MIRARPVLCPGLTCPGMATGQSARQGAGVPDIVGRCRTIGALSPEAQRIRASRRADPGPDGRPLPDTIRLVEVTGGGAQAVGQAFQMARRALLRCAEADPDIPPLTAGDPRTLEITFDPSAVAAR